MAFITSPSVSVQNDSKTVEVGGNIDLSSVDEGWAVQIGTNKLVEASSGTAPNSSGISVLTLFKPWQNGNVTAEKMEIIPNSGYQIALAKRIKSIVDRTIDVMQLQHDYASQLGQVTATDPDTNEQHVYNTLRQNQSEIDALLESFGNAVGYDVTISATDTSDGANGQAKLLKVGDGGFTGRGIKERCVNVDDKGLARGKYYISNPLGILPDGFTGFGFFYVDTVGDPDAIVHKLIQSGSQGAAYREWTRLWHAEVEQPGIWREALHTGNTGITPSTNGNLGIGTSMPESKFHIKSSDDLYLQFTKDGVGASRIGQTGTSLTLGSDLGNGSTEHMRINAAGNALIGTTTDNGVDKLQVAGSISALEGTYRGEFVFDNRDKDDGFRKIEGFPDGGSVTFNFSDGIVSVSSLNGAHQVLWDLPIYCLSGRYIIEIHGFTSDGSITGSSSDLASTPVIGVYTSGISRLSEKVTNITENVNFKFRSSSFLLSSGDVQISLHFNGYAGARAFSIKDIKLVKVA